MTSKTWCAALCLCLAALPATAHDFWIEPRSYQPAAGARVAVELKVGEHFEGSSVARRQDRMVRFSSRGPAGESPLPGLPGSRPAGVLAAAEGLHVLAYESRPASITLAAEKFESYLREEGLESIVSLRHARGEGAAAGRERYSRSAKSLVRAGEVVATDAHLQRAGLPLELVPERDPYALTPGRHLPLTLLFRGEPVASVQVVAIPAASPREQLTGRTDGAGRVAFDLTHPGAWLLKAVHMEAAPEGAKADWESWWASLTFEVPDS